MFEKPDNIPDKSMYLPGIGTSAFFHIEATNDKE